MVMHIRLAAPGDAAAIQAIYAQYIVTTVTFEYQLPSVDQFVQRINTLLPDFPWLVALDGKRVVGYAYAHHLAQRPAYQWDAELSVYVDAAYGRQGLGTALYRTLMALLAAQGIRSAYACVTVPNPASDALHRRLGFTAVGRYPHAGYKDGSWHDVAWYQKDLTAVWDAPAPWVAFSRLDPAVWRPLVEEAVVGRAD